MRTPMKAAAGILAAAAMLAVPAFSNAQDIQGTQPQDTQTQSQAAAPDQTQATAPATQPDGQAKDTATAPAAQPDTTTTPAAQPDKTTAPAAQPAAQGETPLPAEPQLPSAQGTCDTTTRSLGGNVVGQLSDNGNGGCKLTITATASDASLSKGKFQAFPGLNTATEITFSGDNLIELPGNSSRLFSGLDKVTSIDLGSADTTDVDRMNSMFENCSSLTSLNLGANFNTGNVENMSRMFDGCSKLPSLNLGGKFDTSSVYNMSDMFEGCSGLTSLNLGNNFNTSSVDSMSDMFYGCSGLTSLNLGGNFNTSSVTEMGRMFQGCSSLTSLDLSNLNTSNVKNMGNMFYDCTNLANLNLGGNFNTSSVTDMSSMFQNCSSLARLDLSNFNTSSVNRMRDMFNGCSGLTRLDLSNFNTSSVGADMYDMFAKCPNLSRLNLGDNTKLDEDAFYPYLNSTEKHEWMQVPVRGTASQNVDPTVAYPYASLASRTQGNAPDRAGVYVLQEPLTLTFKPFIPLPAGTHIAGDRQKTATFNSIPDAIESADDDVVMNMVVKAPQSQFTLLDNNGNPVQDYQFIGWIAPDNSTSSASTLTDLDAGTANPYKLYKAGSDIDDPNSIPDMTLYEAWMPSTVSGGTIESSASHHPGMLPLPPSMSGQLPLVPPTKPGGTINVPMTPKPGTPGNNNGNGGNNGANPGNGNGNGNGNGGIGPAVPAFAAPGTLGITPSTLGRDSNATPAPRRATPHKTNPKCEPVVYRDGSIQPAAYKCVGDDAMALSTAGTTRQAPLWIFFLLLLLALFAILALTRRNRFDIVRHRADTDATR
ncbi:BspA family leucine-rich repeat surface protein [Bifidobacterium sp. ESL0790]|uniref:BspA family leucine-rich repeat surface protein n=1 Tax=Bifidobacterium sp. ESL0790 TaxID=2983233 RepID=UPI0023F617CC|nr:BspA family leucine-rich repeat surface protein [Bifidobacterium sp. ESL0790]WEV72507.1 BspA family leucine-rich repeat surface protein [Bifidobacterium sp. ESL0790]